MKRESMADVAGVNRIKNRDGLSWEEFEPGVTDIPSLVKAELTNLMSEFENKFNEYAGSNKTRMIWAYVTHDPSIQQSHINAIDQSNDPRKDKFKELIDWMNKYGVRLFMSPNGISRHKQKTGQQVQDSSNTSNKWIEQFGYIWGLKKVGHYKDKRDASDVSDEHAELIKQNPAKQQEMELLGQKLMTVVTAQINGAYGIFFSDGNNITPVIGNDYYSVSDTNHHNREWVNWDSFRSESGQHSKYFGVSAETLSGEIKKTLVYPTSTQFFLTHGEEDSNPEMVSKADLKSKVAEKTEYIWNNGTAEMIIPRDEINRVDNRFYSWDNPDGTSVQIPSKQLKIKEQPLYYLWIKNDGTLWWVPKEARNEVAGKERKSMKNRDGTESEKPFPLTREQVNFFNMFNGKHVVITKPQTHVYSWESLPSVTPEEKQEKETKIADYQQKTQLMDDLWDFFASHPNKPPTDVRLQATKYVIIGPQFKEATNSGLQETTGRLKSHHTHIGDINPGSSDFYGIRKGWVIVGGEFNAARAEARGEKGLQPAQSTSGMGPMSSKSTVFEAIDTAFKDWKINAQKPSSDELQAAQQSFDMAHGTVASPPVKQNAIPMSNQDENQVPLSTPYQTVPIKNPSIPPQAKPSNTLDTIPKVDIVPKKIKELATASRNRLIKDAFAYIRKLKNSQISYL